MRTRDHIAIGVLGAVLALAGCAQSGVGSSGAGGPSSGASAGVASPSAGSPSPSPVGPSASAATMVLTGQVEAGVEPRCLIMRDGGDTYQLIGGDPNVVKAGAHVRVTGHLAIGVMSYCMQGKAFEVTSAQTQ